MILIFSAFLEELGNKHTNKHTDSLTNILLLLSYNNEKKERRMRSIIGQYGLFFAKGCPLYVYSMPGTYIFQLVVFGKKDFQKSKLSDNFAYKRIIYCV